MAQRTQRSQALNAQTPCSTDIKYSNYHSSPQSSVFSSQDTSIQQTKGLSSSENSNDIPDIRPALPPKPAQGPPSYRDPPSPPNQEEIIQHPDICINSKPSYNERKSRPSEIYAVERPENLGCRTQAWVQEHKTSGKLVGEKLSSIQRKLRSLLTQSNKESTEVEKDISLEAEKTFPERHDAWSFHSTNEPSIRPKSAFSSCSMPSELSSQDLHQSYVSSGACGNKSSALTSAGCSSHSHPGRSFMQERHPFGAPVNISEHEESTDTDHLRDTCNKLFSREQRISWTNYLSPRNCYSNNIKSTYDFDKLAPKEVIGRPCSDKKHEISANDSVYDVTPLPSFNKFQGIHTKTSESLGAEGYDGACFARKVSSYTEEIKIEDSHINDSKVLNKGETSESLPYVTTECSDLNDFYKSSSESGRGTMHSSMHGSKSVVSPHSSGVSAASNLDTSLDSDHSINGTLWSHQNQGSNNEFSKDDQVSQSRHIYETPKAAPTSRQATDKIDDHDDETSESLSVTPPLPPLSPAPSPPENENSPKLSRKYKLSLSASAINSSYNKPNEHHQKVSEICSAKPTSGKKSGVRRTSSITQSACRHRNEKPNHCTKGCSSTHRSGTHGNCSSKKYSPPSRHTRNQIAMPSFYDNGDLELTSTTTGLDMESLLDEADDYSSDLSATASTMEPSEVSIIRKQLEGLETMYSEILRLLGVKNSCKDTMFSSAFDVSHCSRRRVNESLSSLPARSSNSRGMHNFPDKRGYTEKRRIKSDCRLSSASKRLQRLESHVVTLARSVAHLSSEMRTQHVLVQELENMRQDVNWVQERMRLMQLAQGCHSGNGANRNHQLAMPRDWDNFHREVLELLNPCRAKKLTKFFGDEPPLIRQFLKRLGYEKYAGNFETEKIGIKELPYLTEERLQKMGIPMGPRIRILQEAHACCQQNQYKVYII